MVWLNPYVELLKILKSSSGHQEYDIKIYEKLRKKFPDLTWSEFKRMLMVLEIRGYIHVGSVQKISGYGKVRLVRLIKRR